MPVRRLNAIGRRLMRSMQVVLAIQGFAAQASDPHYNPAGFFDIHVCNWPDQPNFLMGVFSTARFDEVANVTVFSPQGNVIGALNLDRYRAFKSPTGQPKRAFITHFEMPHKPVDGWYRAAIMLKDGSRYTAKDYVVHFPMPAVATTQPADQAQVDAIPSALTWLPVPGATHYQVTLRDIWAVGGAATVSDMLTQPQYVPPPGVLQSGGEYAWRVHARDSNGNVLLGDFNHGSLSREMRFAIK